LRVAPEDPAHLAEVELPALLDLLPSGVVIVDGRGRPVLINAAARRLVGDKLDPRHSVVDASMRYGLRQPDNLRVVPRRESPVTRALRGETVEAAEYLVPRPEAEDSLRLRVSTRPLRDRFGEPVGAVSVLTDVTLERRLEQAEQRLRLALEASQMGTWDYDVAHDRVEWSPAQSAAGGSASMESGKLSDMLKYVADQDRLHVERALRDAIQKKNDLELETRVVRADGTTGWVLAKGRVFRDDNGRPQHVTGVVMDITERKEAETAQQRLAHGERLRALGQMAGGIAHDLNQSLALISGYSEMARQELQLAMPDLARIREMSDITARAAIDGGQALNRLLSFARTHELLAESEAVELGDVLRDAARLTAPRWRDGPQAEGRPIELILDCSPGCTIEGSPSALREAVTNLIFNAVDALPRGGIIRLRCTRPGERVQLEVSDTGTGIPPEVKPRIFDPFFTTKGERGTGIGLAQVLAIVERHRGNIDLESEPGKGTIFRVAFPASQTSPTTPGRETAERSAGGTAGPIRILVVDDEAQLARMASLALGQRGHDVEAARSGEEAVAELERDQFDLVVSDLGLGAGMNGWDLAEIVRRRWPGTTFVLVTGWGPAISAREARERGVHQVLAKPYRIAELRRIADRVAAGLESR
jgi:PAS domain S-box-containing protein